MIEITYNNGQIDTFEIYSETDTHITWEDYACNFIRINKHTGRTTLLHDGEWIDHNPNIASYRKI